MPFDNLPLSTIRTNRALLEQALRDESMRPADFYWNYAHPTSCAMGLAWRMGIVAWPFSANVGHALMLPMSEVQTVFVEAPKHSWFAWDYRHVSPRLVARLLRRAYRRFPAE